MGNKKGAFNITTGSRAAARAKFGITDSLIRLSVGLEAIEDLQEDLDRAMNW